jgi:hypothetical protein
MNNIDKSELFDYSNGYERNHSITMADNLSEWHYEEALRFYKLFNELWGLALFSGLPGSGKDVLGNYLSWVIYNAFPSKKLLRDEKPRELFGIYDGLFNDTVLSEDLDRMKSSVNSKMTLQEKNTILETVADTWVKEHEILLSNSILYLVEYWNYCYKREPHKPMNKTMGAIHKMKRHLQTLIFGTVQLMSDLDKYTCLPFIDWEIKCQRSAYNPTWFIYRVFKCSYLPIAGLRTSQRHIYHFKIDGAKPVTDLGMPINIIKEDYIGSKQERRILDAIKSGIVTYEDLHREIKIRKAQYSVLHILKSLYMSNPQVINYGCWFNTFNSISTPQIRTRLQ